MIFSLRVMAFTILIVVPHISGKPPSYKASLQRCKSQSFEIWNCLAEVAMNRWVFLSTLLYTMVISSLQFHKQGKIEPRSIPRYHRQHNEIKAKEWEKVIIEQEWNRLQVCPLQDLLPLPQRKAEDYQRTATNKHSAHLLSWVGGGIRSPSISRSPRDMPKICSMYPNHLTFGLTSKAHASPTVKYFEFQ